MHYSTARLLFIVCGIFLAFVPTLAQDTTRLWSRPNVLKTNLLAPISLFYERALTPRFALRTSVRWWQFGVVAKDEKFVNATIEGKIYTAKMDRLLVQGHPTGFFINPYLKVRSLRYVNEIGYGMNKAGDLDEIKIKSIGFGLTIGFMWVLKHGLVLELVHGGGFMPDFLTSIEHTMRYSTVISDPNRIPIDLRTGFSLGYAF